MDNKVLDLSNLGKTEITVKDGDKTSSLYLNLSDMNLVARFQEKHEQLEQIGVKASELDTTSDNVDGVLSMGKSIKELDTELRGILDYIFDAPVSEVCMPFGSAFDMINGQLRYEHILDGLMSLYSDSINNETAKLKKLQKHTSKYVKA